MAVKFQLDMRYRPCYSSSMDKNLPTAAAEMTDPVFAYSVRFDGKIATFNPLVGRSFLFDSWAAVVLAGFPSIGSVRIYSVEQNVRMRRRLESSEAAS